MDAKWTGEISSQLGAEADGESQGLNWLGVGSVAWGWELELGGLGSVPPPLM